MGKTPPVIAQLEETLKAYGLSNGVPEKDLMKFVESAFEAIDTGPLDEYVPVSTKLRRML